MLSDWPGGKLFLCWVKHVGPYSAHEALKQENNSSREFMASLVDQHQHVFYGWILFTDSTAWGPQLKLMCMWSLLMEQKGMSNTGRTWMAMHGVGASDASYRKFKDEALADSIQQLKYKTSF